MVFSLKIMEKRIEKEKRPHQNVLEKVMRPFITFLFLF